MRLLLDDPPHRNFNLTPLLELDGLIAATIQSQPSQPSTKVSIHLHQFISPKKKTSPPFIGHTHHTHRDKWKRDEKEEEEKTYQSASRSTIPNLPSEVSGPENGTGTGAAIGAGTGAGMAKARAPVRRHAKLTARVKRERISLFTVFFFFFFPVGCGV